MRRFWEKHGFEPLHPQVGTGLWSMVDLIRPVSHLWNPLTVFSGRRGSSCRNPPEWRRNPRLYFFVMFSGRSRRCFDFYQKPQFAFGENRVERSSFWFGIRKCGSECVDHTHQMNQIWLCSRTVISHPDWKLASISKTVEEIFSGVC